MRLLFSACLVLLICSCSNIRKEDLGLARVSPNEKLVEQRKPLVLPSSLMEEQVPSYDN